MASLAFTEEVDIDATYFHPAASFYIHGDTTSASNLVTQGLSIYPDDKKLKQLQELLKKQQEQEQQQQDQKNKDKEKQEKKEQPEQPEDPNEQQEGEPQTPEEQQSEQEAEEEQSEQEQQPAEPESAEKMSEDEARQLLDAMRQEEKNKRLQLRPVQGSPIKVKKDW